MSNRAKPRNEEVDTKESTTENPKVEKSTATPSKKVEVVEFTAKQIGPIFGLEKAICIWLSNKFADRKLSMEGWLDILLAEKVIKEEGKKSMLERFQK